MWSTLNGTLRLIENISTLVEIKNSNRKLCKHEYRMALATNIIHSHSVCMPNAQKREEESVEHVHINHGD